MKNHFWMLFTYRSFSATWCTWCFGKRTEGQRRGRRRLRRTGQWTRRVRHTKYWRLVRDKIFVPESSGHKPGLAETEVMPLPEGSDAHHLPEGSDAHHLPEGSDAHHQTERNDTYYSWFLIYWFQLISKDHTFNVTPQLFNLIFYYSYLKVYICIFIEMIYLCMEHW